MKTLLFYDLEASGLRSLDQVLSYAAIRTNMDLEILDKTSIEVAWRRDMIPSAEAYMVHHIGISGRETVMEAEAMRRIHAELNQPNTFSGGYNTLGFDDELLRFSFYRCLLPPYTHQYLNGCGRFDVLPMVLFYYLYANDVLSWPKIEGKPSFKLEALNKENNWVQGRAHEAMVDVEVTLALMNVLRKRQDIWNYLMGFFDKQIDQKRTYQLFKPEEGHQDVGIMVNLFFGYERLYQAPVLFLGPHSVYKNQVVLLRLDEKLKGKSESEILACTVRKKFGEPGFILPYRSPYQDKLTLSACQNVEENLEYLRDNLERIKSFCTNQSYEVLDNVDIDTGLYQKGFLSAAENQWCQAFHQVLEKSLETCPSTDLKQQALRYLWRYYPQKLSEQWLWEADQSIYQYLHQSIDHRNRPGLRIDEALSQVDRAKESTTDKSLLAGLEEIKQHIFTVSKIAEAIAQRTE